MESSGRKLWGWKTSEVFGNDVAVFLGRQSSEVKQQTGAGLKGSIRQTMEVIVREKMIPR